MTSHSSSEAGASLLEYALLVVLIALLAIPALRRMQAPVGTAVCGYVHFDQDTANLVDNPDGTVGCQADDRDPSLGSYF